MSAVAALVVTNGCGRERVGPTTETTFKLSKQHALKIAPPPGWVVINAGTVDRVLRLQFVPRGRREAQFYLVLSLLREGTDPNLVTSEDLQRASKQAAEETIRGKTASAPMFFELRGKQGIGYFYRLEDLSLPLPPGDRRDACQGFMAIGQFRAKATILYELGEKWVLNGALETLENAEDVTPR